ncbi:MAG TPA: hypothetical protein VFC09_03130 [Candidatus Dormibacteraeota bacterium]|nr:hypothetical protein [Candidatus Dormibacteraeota bacterium]
MATSTSVKPPPPLDGVAVLEVEGDVTGVVPGDTVEVSVPESVAPLSVGLGDGVAGVEGVLLGEGVPVGGSGVVGAGVNVGWRSVGDGVDVGVSVDGFDAVGGGQGV